MIQKSDQGSKNRGMQRPGTPREPVSPPLYLPWLMGKFQEN